RSAAAGSSTRGSSWATTPSSFSSPDNELTNASELSRPTVKGRTAPGKRTVSRTGKIASVSGTKCFLSAIGSPYFRWRVTPPRKLRCREGEKGARTCIIYKQQPLVQYAHIL